MTTPAGGTGVGVNITPVPLSNRDNEAKAETFNAKKALAMVDDLQAADVPFVEQRSYAYDNRNAARPKLSHPTHKLRVAVERQEKERGKWQKHYEELLKHMSKEIKEWMQWQRALQPSQRDPNYFAFHATIVLASESLAWFFDATSPLPPDSAAFERAQINLLTPYIAAHTLTTEGNTLISRIEEMLLMLGPNDPAFDPLTNLLSQTKSYLQSLNYLLKQQDSNPTALNSLQQRIAQLHAQYHHTTPSHQLYIIGHLIDSLHLTTSALAQGPGPASVLWMLSFSSLGKTAQTPTMDQLTTQLSQGLNPQNSAPLKHLLHTALIALTTTLPILASHGIGNSTDENIRSISLELTIQLLLGTQTIPRFYEALTAKITTDPKQSQRITDTATLATLALIPFTFTTQPERAQQLFTTLTDEMKPWLERVCEHTKSLDHPIKLYLQQAQIALERQSYPAFQEAINGILNTFTLSPKRLMEEIGGQQQLATLIVEAIAKSPDDPNNRLTTIHAA